MTKPAILGYALKQTLLRLRVALTRHYKLLALCRSKHCRGKAGKRLLAFATLSQGPDLDRILDLAEAAEKGIQATFRY